MTIPEANRNQSTFILAIFKIHFLFFFLHFNIPDTRQCSSIGVSRAAATPQATGGISPATPAPRSSAMS